MNGIQGIVIAAALGIVGAVCNWFYVSRQAAGYQKVAFVAVSPDAQVNLGDKFREEHLTPVYVPQAAVGNLTQSAVLWSVKGTVVGQPATKAYFGGEILLHQDLKTAEGGDLSSKVGENERVLWLPVDARTFEPTHVNPGDQVSFLIPGFTGRGPTPLGSTGQSAEGGGEILGPFRILALGSRTASRNVQRAQGLPSGRENMMAVSVRLEGNRLESRAERLTQVLAQTNFQQVVVLLHPSEKKE